MKRRRVVYGDPITTSEMRTLAHFATGVELHEIADGLGLSVQTIKNQLSACYIKLGVTNGRAAAYEMGWVKVAPRKARSMQPSKVPT